jgi:hypothetical protein
VRPVSPWTHSSTVQARFSVSQAVRRLDNKVFGVHLRGAELAILGGWSVNREFCLMERSLCAHWTETVYFPPRLAMTLASFPSWLSMPVTARCVHSSLCIGSSVRTMRTLPPTAKKSTLLPTLYGSTPGMKSAGECRRSSCPGRSRCRSASLLSLEQCRDCKVRVARDPPAIATKASDNPISYPWISFRLPPCADKLSIEWQVRFVRFSADLRLPE